MTLLSVSHRRQIREADCLAACAAMVLDYLYVPVEYPRLLHLLQIRSFGTFFSSLLRLRSLGLSVEVNQGRTEHLLSVLEAGLPPIVFVNTGELKSYWREETDHAVVVVGLEDDVVYVNDPEFDTAPLEITRDEFELAWADKDRLYAVIGLDATE